MDTHAPLVTFTCVSWNNTVRPTANETICMNCGLATDESVLGCRILYSVVSDGSPGGTMVPATPTSLTTALVHTHVSQGGSYTMRCQAVDAAGNVGPMATLTWVVDLVLPITGWPSFVVNTTDTADVAPQFVFSCNRIQQVRPQPQRLIIEIDLRGCRAGVIVSRRRDCPLNSCLIVLASIPWAFVWQDCQYKYSLDGASLIEVGAASASQAGATDTAVGALAVDSTVALLSALVSNSTTASLRFAAVVNGTVVNLQAGIARNTTLQLRLDGSAMWVDVRSSRDVAGVSGSFDIATGLLVLTGLSNGQHALQVRAVDAANGPDTTPWTAVWYVDRQAPVLSFVVTPPASSGTPASSATLIVVSSSPYGTTFQYRVSTAASVGTALSGSGGAIGPWLSSASGLLTLAGLTPGLLYTLDVYGVDDIGNIGFPISWSWSTAPCTAPEAVVITGLQSYPIRSGTRSIVWQGVNSSAGVIAMAGYEFSLDSATNWVPVADTFVVLDNLKVEAWHNVSVRARQPDGCAGVMPQFPTQFLAWFELGPPPGLPRFLVTPAAVMTSSYASFELGSTTSAIVSLLYSLDQSSWAGTEWGRALPVSLMAALFHMFVVGGAIWRTRARMRPITHHFRVLVVVLALRCQGATLRFRWGLCPLALTRCRFERCGKAAAPQSSARPARSIGASSCCQTLPSPCLVSRTATTRCTSCQPIQLVTRKRRRGRTTGSLTPFPQPPPLSCCHQITRATPPP